MSTPKWNAALNLLRRSISSMSSLSTSVDLSRQAQVVERWGMWPDRYVNPLTRTPRRYWSQSDEDGILEHVLTRIGPLSNGVFVEYGVGDGSECNTLALLARGWTGSWISGEDLMFKPHPGGRLYFKQEWITVKNILSLTQAALNRLGVSSTGIDVLSLDLDGNDFHFTKALLEGGILPRVWICEYNGRFPVGSLWVMNYDPNHRWTNDDYFGASISAFAELFRDHNYFPVACSAQGANVFFVAGAYRDHFKDVPLKLEDLYQPPLYGLAPNWAHKPSARTLASLTIP